VDKPLRISISDVFKGGTGGISVAGKVESGYISKDDQIVVMPGSQVATVKNIESHGESSRLSLAGENIILTLTGIEREHLRF